MVIYRVIGITNPKKNITKKLLKEKSYPEGLNNSLLTQ
jgi:hypothetical protein